MPKRLPKRNKRKAEVQAKPLFSKILIANRGEIACRIIRTCQRLGIKAVAVYSDADKSALHVRIADEAVHIGKSPAAESYLNARAIIRAAQRSGAEAIHPGYGFLSENAAFVQACQKAGLVFIGPSAEVMDSMKDKVQARRLAQEAGLPLLPGSEGVVKDEEAMAVAEEIGFPVMVKSASGGGGIGIRLVHTPQELPDALKRSRALADSAFGDSDMYIEKYLEHPSHIEVQVLADHHGNSVHLFERDCSVQRRNQKIIEETPSEKLNKGRRKSMCEAALALVHHLSYTNAGTVEFIADEKGRFYFLEMNTRLQVEHPVTEMITGLDIVEQQIRIAAGEPLAFSQKNVRRRGHSIEARIYPEDPTTFIPLSGVIKSMVEPSMENVRVDNAAFPGYEVTPYYDSLIAKLIVWGKNRKRAIDTMMKALDEFKIEGIVNNLSVIRQVLQDEEFKDGEYSTQILSRLSENADRALTPEEEREAVAAVAVALGAIFGNGQEQRSSSWKTYGRSVQMAPRLGRGGLW